MERKKSQRGKEENLLTSLCSVPTRFGRLAGQATRYRLRRKGPRFFAKINLSKPRSPHEWTWYVSFGTSTIHPFSTTLELLHVPNIFSYLKRRWRSETDRTKCIKRLSHKKFNTTNNSKGLSGRVVTGTQVSLEFLQINSTTMWQCAPWDVGDWIKSVVWLKDLLWHLSRKKVSEMRHTKQYKHVMLKEGWTGWGLGLTTEYWASYSCSEAVSILTAERLDHSDSHITSSRVQIRELSIFLSFYMYFH